MDHRKALPPGTLLPFPAMPCTLAGETGRGSNAIVYMGSYPDLLNPDERHTVLVKELFPLDQNGAVYRDENGAVACSQDGQDIWNLHLQSFQHGNHIHLCMLERHPDRIGANLNTFSLQGTLYTVLGFTGGRSLAEESSIPETDLRRLTVRMLDLLEALGAFHGSGFLHLDVAPDNILLIGHGSREQVMLIDYNSVYDIQASSQDVQSYHSVKPGFTAPELRTGGEPSVSADLYSIAAVFYRCLSGSALTPFQMSRPNPPDVSACPGLRNQPDTVCVMVRQILRRGLQALPKKRYPSVNAMRQAFQELLDRIDGVGVTHWALWESGRKIVDRVISENPGLAFLRERETMLPTRLRLSDGTLAPISLSQPLEWQQHAVLLTASGGMGKTTAMLRSIVEQSKSYSSIQPAMVYVSLYGWKEGESAYIYRRLLENLRFKTEQYDAARHALDTLLETPLQTPSGECRPVLILLLDGLNEASGSTGTLIDEILSLSRLPGLQLVVSGRSSEPALPFPQVELAPLTEEDVHVALSRDGLLMPESSKMQELLRTPLMLSIFLQSARAGERQLSVTSREELLCAYFSALLQKEIRSLPDDTQARWQIDAAISFVLPAIAHAIQRKKHALEDAELLPCVERCYLLFSDPLLRRAFPQWIGHSKAIRGGAANAEEWYGLLVHDLLWKRLGLLVRNEQGRYQICHEIVADHLDKLEDGNAKKLLRRRRLRRCLAAVALLLCLVFGWFVYHVFLAPPVYSPEYAEPVFVYSLTSYANAAQQYEKMCTLVNCALETPEWFSSEKKHFDSALSVPNEGNTELMLHLMESMLATGKVFSWSHKKLDSIRYQELLELEQERWEEYKLLADVLAYVVEDERGSRLYGEKYLKSLSELLALDGQITEALYQLVCTPHLTQTLLEENQYILPLQKTLAVTVPDQNQPLDKENNAEEPQPPSKEINLDRLSRNLVELQGKRTNIRNSKYIQDAIGAYRIKEGLL